MRSLATWTMVLLGLATAGCFPTTAGDGSLKCAAGGQCPSGYHCASDDRCYKAGDNPSGSGDMGHVIGGGGGGGGSSGDMAGGGGGGGISVDMADACGNGVVDPGELCDPGPGSPTPCPKTASDCDDKNGCTADSVSGSGCQAVCAHAPTNDNGSCQTTGGTAGVCAGGSCCTGCVQNGTCVAGTSDAHACGTGGNGCFDCTQNSVTATCSSGTCTGCDATSCQNEGRTCGTSSCGFACGTCQDACIGSSGGASIQHYACVSKTCEATTVDGCGYYAACDTAHTCSSCNGDSSCTAAAFCTGVGGTCKARSGALQPCTAEGSQYDHECTTGLHCTWLAANKAVCASSVCTGCSAPYAGANGTTSCTWVIPYNQDPRNTCAYVDPCHPGVCSGETSRTVCADGLDQRPGTPGPGWNHSCGAVTISTGYTSPSHNAYGIGKGYYCNDSNQCIANVEEDCYADDYTVWSIDSTGNCNF